MAFPLTSKPLQSRSCLFFSSGLLNFKTFYRNRQFFNWWRGYQEPEFDENEDYMDDYIGKVIRIDNRREPESPFS